MDEELSSSELGTKEYWDEVYKKEYGNFCDSGDTGEVWFGSESVERIIKWLGACEIVTKQSSVLDLGCGNGNLLTEMYKEGYEDLTGVDYCQSAIDLAVQIARQEEVNIKFEACDIVADAYPSDSCLSKQYDLCIDKGTYDAISLTPEKAAEHKKKYRKNLLQLLKPGGLFIITSCNWTEEELRATFSQDLSFIKKIPTPTFQFGGVTGNRETAIIFQKA